MSVKIEFTGDETGLVSAISKVAQENQKLEASLQEVGTSGNKTMQTLIKEFARYGAEGKKIAQALKDHFAGVGKQSIGELKNQITNADARAAIEAATNSVDTYIAKLREIGPEGGRVADHVKKKLESAGQGGRKEISAIIAEIHKIDPAAAKAGARINSIFGRGQEQVVKFGKSAVGQMGSIAAGVVSIGSALQLVNTHLERKLQLLRDARAAQLGLAPAQQRATLNLTGVDEATKRRVLESDIPKIATETGFADLSKLSDALGAAYSSSGDLPAALDAVRAAATLQTQNAEAVTATAAAALDVARASGLSDPRRNLSLVLAAGSFSRVDDPRKLMETIAPAAANAVSTVPQQDRLSATREAMALFGAFTKASNDTSGNSTSKGVIDIATKLSALFRDLPVEIAKSQAEIEKTRAKIRRSGLNQRETRERAMLEAALDEDQLEAARKSRADLLDAKARLRPGESLASDQVRQLRESEGLIKFAANLSGQARDSAQDRLSSLNDKAMGSAVTRFELMKLESLERFIEDSKDVGDTSSLGSRINLITQRQGLRDKLFETEFGESQLKQAFQSLFDEGSLVRKDYESARRGITGDISVYQEQAVAATRGTSQLKVADVQERIASRLAAYDMSEVESAIRAQVQQTLDDVLPRARSGVSDTINELVLDLEEKVIGRGSTAEDEVRQGIETIENRIGKINSNRLFRPELTEAEKRQIELLTSVRDELKVLREVARNTKQNPYQEAAKASRKASASYAK
jgi:hypothetical protein